MNKLILCFLLLTTSVFGQIKWTSQHIFKLKKDEIGRISIYENGKDEQKYTFDFILRWTLYDSQKVVVLSNYRGFPRQHTLYFKRSLRSFRQSLLPDKKRNVNKKAYLLVYMDEYDKKKEDISFMIFLKDPEKRLGVSYIDPKKAKK